MMTFLVRCPFKTVFFFFLIYGMANEQYNITDIVLCVQMDSSLGYHFFLK